MQKQTITAAELDAMFDAGEDISMYLDWENARRPGLKGPTPGSNGREAPIGPGVINVKIAR